jgi:hypothetical protein
LYKVDTLVITAIHTLIGTKLKQLQTIIKIIMVFGSYLWYGRQWRPHIPGGSNEPPDLEKKIKIYRFFFFFK